MPDRRNKQEAVESLAAPAWSAKGSLRRFWRAARQAGQPWRRFLHAVAYAGSPYGYIGAAIGERPGAKWLRLLYWPFLVKALNGHAWAESYHGKVVSTEAAHRLVTIREEINTTVPDYVIPFAAARDLVMSHPDHIVALDCPCRLSRKNPCLPLDVCLIVGAPFASFVLEHQRARARAITPDEAVAILDAEAQRGHVHHAFFKDAMLDRFYAICNCCSCCCGAISAQRHGAPMVISSGYVAQVDEALCVACGACVARCPFEAIQVNGCAQVDAARCVGCGVCVRGCAHSALTLARDASKPAPLEI